MDQNQNKPRHRVGLFFPLLLITVGLVLLIQNLSGQELAGWGTILRLWPLVLIFGGIDGLIQLQGAGTNIFWITFGLALLLSNFNRISWTTWEILLSLWPVFLVALGIDLVIGRRTIWHRVAAGFIVLLIMGGVVVYFDTGPSLVASQSIKVEQNRLEATQGVVDLEPVVSYLKVYAQGSQELLVDGSLQLWEGEKTERNYEVKDNTGTFSLKSSGFIFIYEPGTGNRANWEVGVSSRIPISIQVDQAVGNIVLDLTELDMERLDSNLALGKTSVILPSGVSFEGTIGQAMGEIVIEVPAGTPLEVIGQPAIGNVSFPPNYVRIGNRFTSPAFSGSEYKVELAINLAIGQVIIRER